MPAASPIWRRTASITCSSAIPARRPPTPRSRSRWPITRLNGQGTRTRLIGRERGYHGVGFGGTSVGGIVNNRKMFGTLLAGVDHLPHTYDREKQAFTKGEPEYGAHFADELERLVNLHGASTIAAVIVEPMAGSTGVLPAPKGYLKRLREITQKHGILLIFDEVITGYGRLGYAFAAERYGVLPDMLTFAKGITNGAAPMGGVLVRDTIHDAFMSGPEHVVELTHGYTYSAHPLACAAALATLDIYRDEKLFERANELEPKFADAVMSLKGEPNVVDIRTVGLTAGIDLAPRPDLPGKRGFDALNSAFHDNDLMLRIAGDTLALTPPLIVSEDQIGEIVEQGRQGDPRGGVARSRSRVADAVQRRFGGAPQSREHRQSAVSAADAAPRPERRSRRSVGCRKNTSSSNQH